ncbi:type I polyketide synthase [Okeania hirsuta]|uniref:type I polyketide synthase n=1 Tax=Okeania hirsuta TaxID=1458930 RepID=UPI000F538457|nr:type I polyketide synthase [Okeania hirsuta]RQH26112.1 polyketide synthase [Okeania hirsuta]
MEEKENHLADSKRVFIALNKAVTKLEAIERAKTEPIAIVGMACRFPGGANDPEKFWQLLSKGVDAITEIPPQRWDVDAYYDPNPEIPGKMYTHRGGFLDDFDVSQFDPGFFGISPREAIAIDPQHRLFLEVCWQALENAGQIPQRSEGSPTGVFVGITTYDYALITHRAKYDSSIEPYLLGGSFLNLAAGRISYILGFTGPSMTIDSACSSSLVTIHQACQSLRQQECQMALAGGVNLMLLPDSMIVASKAKMLSPDGYCKTFDAAANGTTWGEGCGVLVLKRLSDALESGDRILALIRGSVVNQDGPSSGFTVPNGNSQKQLIHQALKAAKIEPSQVSYIETHGTGTALGDPIELNSLAEVFGAERTKKKPLMIGSVKTNIGHLSSAAGIAGVIKAILQLQHQQIAPHLHFKNPTPKFNWKDFPLVVPTELTSWQVKDGTRIAGINSFGASGTNAHLILEEAPVQDEMHPPILNQGGLEQQLRIKSERPKHLLTLSAKTEKALAELVSCYQNHLQIDSELKLEDICYTANSGRFHFHHRLAILASNLEELVSKLAHHQKAAKVAGLYTNKVSDNNSQPKKAFLFTGQGSQYLNMGKELYQTQPLFRHTVDQCSQLLQPYLEHSLLSVIYPDTQTTQNSDLINQTAYTQPALFAIEYALCQLWRDKPFKTIV